MENKTIVVNSIQIEGMIQRAVTKALNEFQESLEQKEEDKSKILNRSEAAEFLSVSLSTLYRWTQQKLIPSHGISDKVYYIKSELIDSLVRTN